ncbi:cellobiose 2-epimerase [bacterium BMS3Bbin03]|nr:cellobiose 2-epimerase [bacterium BMS3Bbin03]
MNSSEMRKWQENIAEELRNNIIPFWIKYSPDRENGGFYGRITNNNAAKKDAPKSLILNARILWTFSAIHKFRGSDRCLELAHRAYDYLKDKFFDRKYGGAFWLLNSEGSVIDDKKKIYGQAFVIYALSEYYMITQKQEVKEKAIQFFNLIEDHNYDKKNGGYFEVSERDWTPAEDSRLGEDDMNEKKSMNNHLHLLEAYVNLFNIWKDRKLEGKLRELIMDFKEYIIDSEHYHFRLFFNEKWEPKSNSISFGHDIEGSWLLYEAVKALGDEFLIELIKPISIKMADATLKEGILENGAIFYEKKEDGTMAEEIHWWPQAESMVGLMNAFQITGDRRYLDASKKAWEFISAHFIDKKNGEWFYMVNPDGAVHKDLDKVSEWKGPYHNSRACMEAIKRINRVLAAA